MNEQPFTLRSNVSLLGKILGDTIKQASGDAILDKVETIRKLSKSSRAGNNDDRQQLLAALQQLSDEELVPVARAFNQFLNLVNTAEQYHSIAPKDEAANHPILLTQLFNRLKSSTIPAEKILQAVQQLSIELVLTAHPTEITRRTLIHKLVEVNNCLAQLDHTDLTDDQHHKIIRRLRQLIAQSWHTDEIRHQQPTPIDEVKWGFAVIENSLWDGVPAFIRELNEQLQSTFNYALPLETTPVRFISWMGGDRDGNPNVTAKVTQQTLLLGRWKAVDLFLRDINTLISELSMTECTAELRQYLPDPYASEPYRSIMKQLRDQLQSTQNYLTNKLQEPNTPIPPNALLNNEQLWQPLLQCYQSLQACNMGIIANGQLLDTLRRIRSFGLSLVKLDIRQESKHHSDAIAELTRYLGIGDYNSWSETDKQTFLIQELNSKRPLIPQYWLASEATQEVIDTCRVIAQASTDSITAYVISMAHYPSDILAVYLLLKEMGCQQIPPVVPLFETLDDLNRACSVMQQLFNIAWYRGAINGKQMAMIGYSDSAKDAGVIAASWAQYRAQEALIELCHQHQIQLTLFHGRGGTIGRGGAPAHAALLSQPPGSLQGGLRVTEQGEMIRFKLGLPEIAVSSLTLYAAAILEANLLPPPAPKKQWRNLMDQLSTLSYAQYRHIVQQQPDFVAYFKAVTPLEELAKLPLGSRPSKRQTDGGLDSLRAIPWIFAWTQNRLLLPAWLGAGSALKQVIDEGKQTKLRIMMREWPFFATRIDMLEMVFAKTDLWLAEYYEHHLVSADLHPLGQQLRTQLQQDIQTVKQLTNHTNLLANQPWTAESIRLRNIYTDPLNLLQIELLQRLRTKENLTISLEQALMITIAGIAAGMRNTG